MSEQIYRQWELINILSKAREQNGLSVADIREKLSVDYADISDRTLQRDLNILETIFLLETRSEGRKQFWSFTRVERIAQLFGLTIMEAISLVMVETHLKNLLPIIEVERFQPYFELAHARINSSQDDEHVLPMQSWLNKVRVLPGGQEFIPPQINPDVQRVVYQGLLDNLQLQLEYKPVGKDIRTYNPINPLGLVQKGVAVYLVVTISVYQNPLLLALHRVQSASLLDTPVLIPDEGFDIDHFIECGGLGFGKPDQWIDFAAVFYHNAGDFLLETPLSLEQQVEILGPGKLQIAAHIPYTPQLVRWLSGFCSDVQVCQPASLREEICQRHEAAFARYDTS